MTEYANIVPISMYQLYLVHAWDVKPGIWTI